MLLIESVLLIDVAGYLMNVEDAKTAIKAVAEVNEERKELRGTLTDNGCAASSTKKLFREGNQSKLIKLGVALIVFPEPTPVSEIVGTGFIAAGVVQKGIKSRAGFAEDIGRDFKKAVKELNALKDQIRV
jgi:hypothetical protein